MVFKAFALICEHKLQHNGWYWPVFPWILDAKPAKTPYGGNIFQENIFFPDCTAVDS